MIIELVWTFNPVIRKHLVDQLWKYWSCPVNLWFGERLKWYFHVRCKVVGVQTLYVHILCYEGAVRWWVQAYVLPTHPRIMRTFYCYITITYNKQFIVNILFLTTSTGSHCHSCCISDLSILVLWQLLSSSVCIISDLGILGMKATKAVAAIAQKIGGANLSDNEKVGLLHIDYNPLQWYTMIIIYVHDMQCKHSVLRLGLTKNDLGNCSVAMWKMCVALYWTVIVVVAMFKLQCTRFFWVQGPSWVKHPCLCMVFADIYTLSFVCI